GNAGAPFGRVVANEIVALARQFLARDRLGRRVGGQKLHPQLRRWWDAGVGSGAQRTPPRGLRLAQVQYGFIRAQQKVIALAAGEEVHPGIHLAPVGFKTQSKLAKGSGYLSSGGCQGMATRKNRTTGGDPC